MNIDTPWLDFYGNIKKHFDYPDISIVDFLEETVNKHSNLVAYNYFDKKVTYKDFFENIKECAKALKTIGVNKGDRVTICMPNTPEAITCFYAVNMIGAIANMIHPLSAESEIKFYLNASESKIALVINIAFEKVKNIIDETNLQKVIVATPNMSMPTLLSFGYYFTKGRKIKIDYDERFISYKEFINLGKKYNESFRVKMEGNDPAVILYSGGTTGTSKGIILSNLNFNALAIQGEAMCDCLKPKDKILSIMPIFHGFGLGICIHTALYVGAEAIILPQFNVDTFDKLLRKYKPNILIGVPTLFEALLRNKNMEDVDLSCLKCVISGGDNLSINLKKKVDNFMQEHGSSCQIREGYGLTECVAGTCLTLKNMYREGSIGIPYPDTYYKIVKPNTHDKLPYGETGEICISGPTVMLGYLNEPKETAHTIQLHEDGLTWLHTGDLGSMDKDGFVYFKNRLKRMIVSSGYNIYPQILENIIDDHPSVLYSTVIGVKDDYRGQIVKAFIVLKDGINPTEEVQESIKNYCKKNIAKYALPKEFEYRSSLPKTMVGKVNFKELEKTSE